MLRETGLATGRQGKESAAARCAPAGERLELHVAILGVPVRDVAIDLVALGEDQPLAPRLKGETKIEEENIIIIIEHHHRSS